MEAIDSRGEQFYIRIMKNLNVNHWFLVAGATLSAALGAYLHAGGPDPIYLGVPVVAWAFSIISLFTDKPSSGAQ